MSKIRDLSFKPKTWEEGDEESGDWMRGEEEEREKGRRGRRAGHKKPLHTCALYVCMFCSTGVLDQ